MYDHVTWFGWWNVSRWGICHFWAEVLRGSLKLASALLTPGTLTSSTPARACSDSRGPGRQAEQSRAPTKFDFGDSCYCSIICPILTDTVLEIPLYLCNIWFSILKHLAPRVSDKRLWDLYLNIWNQDFPPRKCKLRHFFEHSPFPERVN